MSHVLEVAQTAQYPFKLAQYVSMRNNIIAALALLVSGPSAQNVAGMKVTSIYHIPIRLLTI